MGSINLTRFAGEGGWDFVFTCECDAAVVAVALFDSQRTCVDNIKCGRGTSEFIGRVVVMLLVRVVGL